MVVELLDGIVLMFSALGEACNAFNGHESTYRTDFNATEMN